MKTWFWSMIFLATMLQLGACSSYSLHKIEPKNQTQQEESEKFFRNKRFNYHTHFDDK